MQQRRYRYFAEVKWAEAFIDGSLLFRSLSHYHRIEDCEVSGISLKDRSAHTAPAGSDVGDGSS